MISYLEGKLVQKVPTSLLIDVGGIGYSVNIPLSSYEKIGEVGTSVKVLTYLSVKEDSLELFGFATEEERKLFMVLIGVSGIGAKLAQGILSGLSVDDFRRSVMREDLEILTSISGIGRKTAQRLLFELRDRFKAEEEAPPVSLGKAEADKREEAVLTLTSLGYKRTVAKKAIERVIRREGETLPLEELIKKALRHA